MEQLPCSFRELETGHVAVVQELVAPHNAVHNIEVDKARTY